MRLDSIGDWGITLSEEIGELGSDIGESILDDISIDVNYSLEDAMIFDDGFDIFKGDVEKYSLGNQVQELDVEIGGCSFEVEYSEDDNYYLEGKNIDKLQGYVKDGTLHVKASVTTGTIVYPPEREIILYVPKNWESNRLDKVDMELGAGTIDMEGLAADVILLEVGAGQIDTSKIICDTLDISVGMGEVLVKDMQVGTLQAEVGMGHLSMEGSVEEKADVECSMGSMELKLEGSQKDFDYDLECGMGNLVLGEDSFSGLSSERFIDNGAGKKMNVECAMGEVEISFTE